MRPRRRLCPLRAESSKSPFRYQRIRATWLGMYGCFRSHRTGKLIGHAVLVPEPAIPMSDAAAATENPNHPPEVRLPFVAPPSSPASFRCNHLQVLYLYLLFHRIPSLPLVHLPSFLLLGRLKMRPD